MPNPSTRNGFDPRPGIVHRPTRADLPPLVGCARYPGPDYGPVHGPAVKHWTNEHIAPGKGAK